MKKAKIEKMTLEEYQERFGNHESKVTAKTTMFVLATSLGVVIAICLFFMVAKLFEFHKIAGYAGIIISLLIFIFFYIVPICKLRNMKSFKTQPSATSARAAQRFNKALREEIADKMIDIELKTEGLGWYRSSSIQSLASARASRDDKALKKALSDVFATDVKVSANKMIRSRSVKVGIATALSQSKQIDAAFVLIYDLALIKDLVFMYGYRPTDSQMAKIYQSVFTSALMTYGVSSTTAGIGKTFGTSIVSMIAKASHSANPMTSAIGSVVGGFAGTALESSIQFGVNYTLTTIIGFQTKKYLMKEYHLQDILDDIDPADSEAEEIKMIESVKKEVKETVGKRRKAVKSQPAEAA